MRASSLRRNTRLTSAAIWAAVGGLGWSRRANSVRSCGTVRAGIFFSQPAFLRLQEPQSQEREGHVVMPTHPRAHLVLPQSHLALAGPIQFLRPVPPAVHLGHLGL